MNRTCARFLLMGFSLSTFVASVLWAYSQTQIVIFESSIVGNGFRLRSDREGVLFTSAADHLPFWPRVHIHPQPPNASNNWSNQLADVAPNWIVSTFVFAKWTANPGSAQTYWLIGLKHFAIVLFSAIVTVSATFWFRHRRPGGDNE